MMKMRKYVIYFSVCLSLLLWSNTAYAYLDPGTGSMMLQLLLAGLAGLAVTLKLTWRRIRGGFGAKKDKRKDKRAKNT